MLFSQAFNTDNSSWKKQLATEITENTELYQSVMQVSCVTCRVIPMASVISCFSLCSPWFK